MFESQLLVNKIASQLPRELDAYIPIKTWLNVKSPRVSGWFTSAFSDCQIPWLLAINPRFWCANSYFCWLDLHVYASIQFFDCLTSIFHCQNPISVIVCCINHTSCYLDPHVWFLFCWWKQHFLVTSSYIQLPNIFAEHIPLCSTSHVLASPFDSVRSSLVRRPWTSPRRATSRIRMLRSWTFSATRWRWR